MNIINVNFMNANSIRTTFNISPQKDFKQFEVYYNYHSKNESVEKTESHWYNSISVSNHTYSYRINCGYNRFICMLSNTTIHISLQEFKSFVILLNAK